MSRSHIKGTYLLIIMSAIVQWSFSQQVADKKVLTSIDSTVKELMADGHIPGLSVVLIDGDKQVIKSFGYADQEQKKQVTENTLFEIGSCTKAFTGLAVSMLAQQGKINVDTDVAVYIPWFRVTYKDTAAHITVKQLLHHTGGIPWNTISKIPVSAADNALELTVKQLIGQELNNAPGKKFEYATINYDVLAYIVQVVTGEPFEAFIQKNVLNALHLQNTTIGYAANDSLKATGYKIGFFRPRPFNAPYLKGNNAAGYIISDAQDMAQWVKFQMGMIYPALYPFAQMTQQRDETVAPQDLASYAMGWAVSLTGNGVIFHSGLNPNYTSYVAFNPASKKGVVVLANSNSAFTPVLGSKIMRLFTGEEKENDFDPGDGNDRVFSVASIVLAGYNLIVLAFLVYMITGIAQKTRKYEAFSLLKLKHASLLLLVLLLALYGLYLLPQAVYDFNWHSVLIWTPVSFLSLVVLIVVSMLLSYITYVLGLFFPEKNKFKSLIPRVVLLSILSGFASMTLVVLITSALYTKVELRYMVFYFLLCVIIYLSTRRFIQVSLIKVTNDAIYDLQQQIISRIFSTSFQRFEQIDRGRVYTTLNDDAGIIGDSTNMFVGLATSIFTAIGAFLYLASIASWATGLTLVLILILVGMYYFVGLRMNKYYVESRDSKNVFMRLINGIIDGFKELSLHSKKRNEYMGEVLQSADDFRSKISTASIRFVHTGILGESILMLILGSVSFVFPTVFPDIKTYTLMSFLVVLLYLIGPVNTILGTIPSVMRLRISWNRMREFLKDIPANNYGLQNNTHPVPAVVESMVAENVLFRYKNKNVDDDFAVGPLNLEIRKGEILFVIGANGSGKTTLAKLLTGLYEPDSGQFKINDEPVPASQLGEYFSAVFTPVYLFERLYNIDTKAHRHKIDKYLKVLHLDKKVVLNGKFYSTINLSGGQRKRLALMQCYLEDAPIFLFDEWAADQDPSYRNFFYRTLLPEMKKMNKIIIAITHDDHYFDVADKVLKMENGKLVNYVQTFC